MERIASLITELNKLQENGAGHEELLAVVNELQVLLRQDLFSASSTSVGRISVWMPDPVIATHSVEQPAHSGLKPAEVTVSIKEEEKEFEVLEVDQHEIEAELAEIRKNAAFTQRVLAQQSTLKPGILFEFEDETETPELPTLVHQKRPSKPEPVTVAEKTPEQDSSPTINEQLKEEKREVVQFLGEAPIKDLRKAIGINDRYLFVQELFRGDEDMYERSIKTINAFSAFGEAHYWMERELKVKIGWDMAKQVTKDFYALVKRRFS